jgi:hypothetical protein
MRNHVVRFVLTAAALLLLVADAPAQDLDAATRAITQAFRSRQAGALRPVLHDGVKTYLSLPSFYPEQGHFGASQVYYIFSDIFARVETRSFQLRPRDDQDSGPVYLMAVWRHAPRQQTRHGRSSEDGKDAERRTVLFLTLESDGGGYALTDIREASP